MNRFFAGGDRSKDSVIPSGLTTIELTSNNDQKQMTPSSLATSVPFSTATVRHHKGHALNHHTALGLGLGLPGLLAVIVVAAVCFWLVHIYVKGAVTGFMKSVFKML
jgi:hypothetical protein